MQGNFSVEIESFAEKHFIKSFQKKYNTYWEITQRAIVAELERIDNLILTDRAETIRDATDVRIVKTKFKVVGTKESAKTSGCRCIAAWNLDEMIVSVLLVYGKTDLGGGNETAVWKRMVRDNYPEYKHLL